MLQVLISLALFFDITIIIILFKNNLYELLHFLASFGPLELKESRSCDVHKSTFHSPQRERDAIVKYQLH